MELSLCLETVFTNQASVDRMREASALSYSEIEFWDWRSKNLAVITETAAQLNLTNAAMSGIRQHALIDPDARSNLMAEMEQAFAAAQPLRCRYLMMLSDVLAADGSAAAPPPLSRKEKFESVVQGLRALVHQASDAGVVLLLEPLNSVLDHRGYFLDHSWMGFEIIRHVGNPQVKLLYDIYPMSMMGEDGVAEMGSNLEWIGYLHIADLPGRHQPGTGKIDYPGIADWLKGVRFDRFIGMEFLPQGPGHLAARAVKETFM